MLRMSFQLMLFLLAGLTIFFSHPGFGQDWKAIRQEERTRQAGVLFKEIQDLHSSMKVDQAKVKMAELVEKYPEVKRARGYVRLDHALKYIGNDAGKMDVSRWYQGETSLKQSGVNLLVFWESWCPHCQESMPVMEGYHKKYQEKGLQIIGLTRVMEPATNSDVMAFIAERDLSFSIGKVDDEVAESFGVDGVPSAAIVKDGIIIWAGSPDLIKEQTLVLALAN